VGKKPLQLNKMLILVRNCHFCDRCFNLCNSLMKLKRKHNLIKQVFSIFPTAVCGNEPNILYICVINDEAFLMTNLLGYMLKNT
jgi:hypothetical protein